MSGLAVFFPGFMVSSFLWCFVAAGLVALLRRALPRPAVRVLEAVSGVSPPAFAALPASLLF